MSRFFKAITPLIPVLGLAIAIASLPGCGGEPPAPVAQGESTTGPKSAVDTSNVKAKKGSSAKLDIQ